MKVDIKREVKRKHEEMIVQLEKLNGSEMELEDEAYIEERQLCREEGAAHDANL